MAPSPEEAAVANMPGRQATLEQPRRTRAACRAAVLLGAATVAALLAFTGAPPPVVAALLATLLLLAPLRTRWRSMVTVALGTGLVLGVLIRFGAIVGASQLRVPEWDFGAFWIHARLAAEGFDFYDRERVRASAAAMGASPAFQTQGRFWNPPQSMLLFLPLGWVDDPRVAYRGWLMTQLVAAALAAWLLWRLLARSTGTEGLAVSAALTASLGATATTLLLGQTHFFVLLFLLLWLQSRERLAGGVWLGLALLLKPVALLVAIEPLVRRRRRVLAGLALTALVSTALALALFGPRTFGRYLQRGAGEIPATMYRMPENQSLLAVLARAGLVGEARFPPLEPIHLALAVPIAVAAIWILARRRERVAGGDLALLLSVALILYPQTLDHYAVLLLPALLLLWRSGTPAAAIAAASATLLVAFVFSSPRVPLVLLASSVCAAGVAWLALARAAPEDEVPGA